MADLDKEKSIEDRISCLEQLLRTNDAEHIADACTSFMSTFKSQDGQWLFLPEGRVLCSEVGNANTDDEVSKILQDKYEPLYTRFAHHLYEYGAMKEFKGREDIGYQTEDFIGLDEKAQCSMSCFDCILKNMHLVYTEVPSQARASKQSLRKVIHCLLQKAFLLCVEHHGETLWSSYESRQSSEHLQQTLCKAAQCKDMSELLCGKSTVDQYAYKPLFPFVLEATRLKVTKDTWKQNPAMIHVFSVCLFHVKFPHLSEYLDMVFPPSLLITDDFQVEHKVLGIKLLKHIMSNCSKTELTWHGRADVIYDTLQHLTYTHEEAVIDALYPCLLHILSVVEKPPTRADASRKENKYDVILQRLLYDMELENKLVLRRACARHLTSFLKVLGITVVKHFKRLFRVIFNYLEIHDGPKEEARISILESLMTTIQYAWPRIPYHSDDILKCLVKLIYDISVDSSTTPSKNKHQVVTKATECLTMLVKVCPEDVKTKLQAIKDTNVNQKCTEALEKALSTC